MPKLSKDAVIKELDKLGKIYHLAVFREAIELIKNSCEPATLDEKRIYSILLAEYKIFDDYKESRISIGKCRELLSQALVGKIPKFTRD